MFPLFWISDNLQVFLVHQVILTVTANNLWNEWHENRAKSSSAGKKLFKESLDTYSTILLMLNTYQSPLHSLTTKMYNLYSQIAQDHGWLGLVLQPTIMSFCYLWVWISPWNKNIYVTFDNKNHPNHPKPGPKTVVNFKAMRQGSRNSNWKRDFWCLANCNSPCRRCDSNS